jgi:HYDIN/CFA65/VesB family protein
MAAFAIALAAILSIVTGATAQVGPSSSSAAKTKLPAVQVTPKKIDFGKLPAGMTSTPHIVTFTNKSDANLRDPNVEVSGASFHLSPFVCPATLPPGDNCQFSVTFTPPSKGEFHGSLTFTDGGARSPQKVKLKGIGLPAVPTPTATATATLTPTPTPTISATPTVSTTPTSSATGTPTATSTPHPAFNSG